MPFIANRIVLNTKVFLSQYSNNIIKKKCQQKHSTHNLVFPSILIHCDDQEIEI